VYRRHVYWSKEEMDFAKKCVSSSNSLLEATEKHKKKFPNRTYTMMQNKFKHDGIHYGDLLQKPSPQQLYDTMKKKDKLVELENELAVLRTAVKDTKGIEELIHGMAGHNFTKIPKWLQPKRQRNLTGIPFLFLSDIHFGEVVDPSQINYINTFNREIGKKRMEFTFKTTVELLLDRFHKPLFDGIVCALDGDMVSGNIHEELSETNDGPILQSVIELTEILIKGITLLADKFDRVFVPCIVGNHGRLWKKPRMKNRAMDNYEWVIYNYIYKHFKDDPRVNVIIPNSPDVQYTIYDTRFCLTHGDQFRGGTGIAGLFSPIMLGMARKQSRQQSVRQPFDIMCIGHWHQLIMTEKLIINGSVKGMDEYAYSLNVPAEDPRQALFIVHPDHGITYRVPVMCNGYEKKKQSRLEVNNQVTEQLFSKER
jgi:hypothetical protein